MKPLLFLLLLPLVLVFAQGSGGGISSLPACGQTCISNALAIGPSLGCSSSDASCLCSKNNFAYAIRDCAHAVCGPDDADAVIAYGIQYCAAFGSAVSTAAPTVPPAVTSTTPIAASSTSVLETSSSAATTSVSSSSASIASQSPTSTSAHESSAPSSTSRASATITSSSTSSPTSPNPKNQTAAPAAAAASSSLSAGAKAGIAIGAVIGILILCLLIYIAFLLKKKNRRDEDGREERNIPELGPGLTTELPVVEKPGELEGRDRKELLVEKEKERVSELPELV